LIIDVANPKIDNCLGEMMLTHARISMVVLLALLLVPLLLLALPSRADIDGGTEINPQVMALALKGWQAYQQKQYLEVPALLNQALAKAREVHDVAGEAVILFAQSEMYRRIGFGAKASQLNDEALKVLHQSNDQKLNATTLRIVGGAFRVIGQPEKSLDFYQQSLALSRGIGDTDGAAATLLRLSQLYSALSQFDKSADFAQQALEAYRQAKNPLGEIDTLALIGSQFANNGNFKPAMDNYQMALSIAQKQNDLRRISITTVKIASLSIVIGQIQKGTEMYKQAINDYEEALKTQPAADLPSAFEDKRVEASFLASLANLLRNSPSASPTDLQLALDHYKKAQELYQQVGDRIGGAVISNDLAIVYVGNKQFDLALQSAQASLAVFGEFKDLTHVAQTLLLIGSIYARAGEKEKALQFYKQGLQSMRQIGLLPQQASALISIADLEENMNQLDDALRDREECLQMYEKLRASLGGLSDFKIGFLEKVLPNYQRHISLLLQTNKPEQAFNWSEKTKARALIDLMYSGKVDLSKGLNLQDRDKEISLRQKAVTLNDQIVAELAQNDVKQEKVAALQKSLTSAEDALQTFTNTLYAKYPQLAQKRAAKTATLADVGQFLPADTALLSYLTMESGKTILFCVTSENGQPTASAYTIAATQDDLGELLSDFHSACANPKKAYKNKAQELYDLLIAPAASQLTGKKRLLICPDGMLWGLPFQALIGKNEKGTEQFLAEQYEVDYAYSASSVQAALSLRKDANPRKREKSLLVMANPDFGGSQRFTPQSDTGAVAKRPISAESRAINADSRSISADSRAISADSRNLPLTRSGAIAPLPGTQVEADALLSDFPDATIYTGKQALEATAKKEAPYFRYVHFATHGFFNDADAMLSSVVMAEPVPGSSEDGFLTAREIYDLNLNADMVVLSACNTGNGQKRSGEGIIGLTWALFVAGTPTQVVSQWSVSDQTTASLMKNFYARLKTGDTKGAALREADLQLMHDGVHSQPFYWAPFVLMGDWGNQ
jgi:CHAT domain-containing protein